MHAWLLPGFLLLYVWQQLVFITDGARISFLDTIRYLGMYSRHVSTVLEIMLLKEGAYLTSYVSYVRVQ